MSLKSCLAETPFFDLSHPDIQSLISRLTADTQLGKVLQAYYLIRDEIPYNPYTFSKGEIALKASYAASQESAYCIPKSALMVAVCRAIGVPAKIGFADVKNHLSSPKLLEWLRTDLFVMHGYAQLFINNKWVKCTPVFNKGLCDKMGIHALDFDGTEDSIFHPFNADGEAHMEYITDHGTFDEMPVEMIFEASRKTYPHINLLDENILSSHRGGLEADI